jgi:hypothetical protein
MYKSLVMKVNNVYSILIEDWDEEVTGVFQAEGKEWILLVDNQNDFIAEGCRFIHKTKVDEILREEGELFKEKIFAKKYSEFSFKENYALNSSEKLFSQILEQNTLIHFDTDDEEEMVVGKIMKVTSNGFELRSLTEDAKWGETIFCDYTEISTVAIGNDYLNSLSLILD